MSNPHYERTCFPIDTTHGHTYCEVYKPFNTDGAIVEPEVCKTYLMVHGLGGTTDHFAYCELPETLARQGYTVVSFDFYSHGRSTQLNCNEFPHNLDLFVTQLWDVVHSPALPIKGCGRFVAHGFSMGCFVLLNFCVRHKLFDEPLPPSEAVAGSPGRPGSLRKQFSRMSSRGSSVGAGGGSPLSLSPAIHKIVLQSPWDGQIPYLLKGLVRVPGLLRLCKPSDMAGIKSVKALKQILLDIGRVDYRDRMQNFAAAVTKGAIRQGAEGGDAGTSGGKGGSDEGKHGESGSKKIQGNSQESQTALDYGVACPVLLIAGTREAPFWITARQIKKRIKRADDAETGSAKGTDAEAKAAAGAAARPGMARSSSSVRFHTLKYAGHMSFLRHKDGGVGSSFRGAVMDFVDDDTA